ncbi:mechanosensitive ion channel family protein [Photobacterium leiognathi]|uniref:mechanosensitive ion channel family protein n=1 Tax=Photobacterium leiognathi TaxID=553611 RepID=UPI0029822852|nr:mechanosensitive ion channel family protein [Photobacterium leiognathi]
MDNSNYFHYIEIISTITTCIIIAIILHKSITQIENQIYNNKKIDNASASIIAQLSRISIGICILFVILKSFNIDTSTLATFGGLSTIAITFAARELLSNILGGLILTSDKSFKVGDWIATKGVEGTVTHIGLRKTILMTFDKRPIYVPNSAFLEQPVINPSRMTNRRIKHYLSLRYEDFDKIGVIEKDIKKYLKNHDEIDNNQIVIVALDKLNENSIDILIYCFTLTTDWAYFHSIQSSILIGINNIIKAHNAEFAYPTRTILLNKNE